MIFRKNEYSALDAAIEAAQRFWAAILCNTRVELGRIDWLTPARVLEKVIAYEAVHKINGWSELRLRVDSPDRRLYAFFHPSLTHEPLIFVEVALIDDIPSSIESILSEDRETVDPKHAKTAVFYSISNCQKGLRGVSFGNFLIKQVVEDLRTEFANIETFVTLSPVPGLRTWIESELANSDDSVLPEPLKQSLKQTLANAGDNQHALANATDLPNVVAVYLLQAKNRTNLPANAVARFHVGNGARLENIHTNADISDGGQANSWGVMVNYLYDLDQIEKNHEAYANEGTVIRSDALEKLLKQST